MATAASHDFIQESKYNQTQRRKPPAGVATTLTALRPKGWNGSWWVGGGGPAGYAPLTGQGYHFYPRAINKGE